jgi:hypothetical protein
LGGYLTKALHIANKGLIALAVVGYAIDFYNYEKATGCTYQQAYDYENAEAGMDITGASLAIPVMHAVWQWGVKSPIGCWAQLVQHAETMANPPD